MPTDPNEQTCRLCREPLNGSEHHHSLCGVCDEYAQHVALHSDKKFDRIIGDLQHGTLFLAATRNAH